MIIVNHGRGKSETDVKNCNNNKELYLYNNLALNNIICGYFVLLYESRLKLFQTRLILYNLTNGDCYLCKIFYDPFKYYTNSYQ